MDCYQRNNIKLHVADWTGMGGSHAPDFATGAAALAYINGLDTAVADGQSLDTALL